MKKISILLALLILSGLCACKAKDEMVADPTVPSSSQDMTDNAETDIENINEGPATDADTNSAPDTQKDPDTNSAPETQKDPDTAKDTDSQTTTTTTSTVKRPENVDHISLNKDGVYYAHFSEGTLAANILRKPTIYEDLDKSSFVKTDEWVEVEYKKFNVADGFDVVATVKAQVYKMPEFAQNNEYAYVIAAKPECEDDILIFSKLKDAQVGDTYGKNLEKLSNYYGFDCTKAENLEYIEIRGYKHQSAIVKITDADKLADFYNKISAFKYAQPRGTVKDVESNYYYVRLCFKGGLKIEESYIVGDYNFNYYKANEEFEKLFLSCIPERFLKD